MVLRKKGKSHCRLCCHITLFARVAVGLCGCHRSPSHLPPDSWLRKIRKIFSVITNVLCRLTQVVSYILRDLTQQRLGARRLEPGANSLSHLPEDSQLWMVVPRLSDSQIRQPGARLSAVFSGPFPAFRCPTVDYLASKARARGSQPAAQEGQ